MEKNMQKTTTETFTNKMRLRINWTADKDGHGWTGVCIVVQDGQKSEITHEISLRQGQPLGKIFVMLDGDQHGAWMLNQFEGVEITERDLQWATIFAITAIKHKLLFYSKLGEKLLGEK